VIGGPARRRCHTSPIYFCEYCLHMAGARRPPSMTPKGSPSEDPPLVQDRKKAHHRKTRLLIPSLVPTFRSCARRADLSHQLRSIRDRLTDTRFAESNATRRNQHVIGAQPQSSFHIAWFVVAYTFQAGNAMDMHLPSTIGCAGDFVSPRTQFSNHFA
jgi:hypothetical protein